ncbi:MAG: molybdate ABC transporter substrate-binding protein [Nitrospirota bacterium]
MKWSVELFTCLLFAVCFMSQPCTASADDITVSAAMSLKGPFEELGREFEKTGKGTKVILNFGASGALRGQIEGGAPVDVFASADEKNMDILDREGLLLRDTRSVFAGNSVVLITPVFSSLQIRSFSDLRKNYMKRIAIGNPLTTPVGRYSKEALKHLRIWDHIKDRVVFAENVRQILDYVSRGEVDAGMLYCTDAMIKSREVKVVAEAPEESHEKIIYPIAVMKNAGNEITARAFVKFVISEQGIEILKKYGFRTAKQR